MKNKYKLTEETINFNDKILYRIEALKDFSDVKIGDKGGFIENESNLSQYGDCWIYDNAKVCGDAIVSDDAIVYGEALVYDNAKVCDNTRVYGNAGVYGDAIICDNANVYDNALIYNNATIYGNAEVYGNAEIHDNALICGNAKIYNNARVCDNTKVCGNAKVCGEAKICKDAIVRSNSDYIVFKNWWSSGRFFTWTRSNNVWKVGCFYGTGKELIEKAYKDSELSGKEYERIVKYVETIVKETNYETKTLSLTKILKNFFKGWKFY